MEQAVPIARGGQGEQPLAAGIHVRPPVQTTCGNIAERDNRARHPAWDWGVCSSPQKHTSGWEPALFAQECPGRGVVVDPSQAVPLTSMALPVKGCSSTPPGTRSLQFNHPVPTIPPLLAGLGTIRDCC